MKIGELPDIESELLALQQHIADYRFALNNEGIWLFLATLGCWSVSQPLLQLLAYALGALLFGERLARRTSETRSFSKLIKIVEDKISATLPEGDTQKARLYDLTSLRKKELGTIKSLAGAKVFLGCWIFFAISFGYSLFQL